VHDSSTARGLGKRLARSGKGSGVPPFGRPRRMRDAELSSLRYASRFVHKAARKLDTCDRERSKADREGRDGKG